jgi:hypothetical protein
MSDGIDTNWRQARRPTRRGCRFEKKKLLRDKAVIVICNTTQYCTAPVCLSSLYGICRFHADVFDEQAYLVIPAIIKILQCPSSKIERCCFP